MPQPLHKLEQTARELASALADVVPPQTGFALLLFDFGEKGNLTYVSNASRDDMIAVLKECIERLESGTVKPPQRSVD